ncbi:MAG: hypothetical protein IJ483_05950 [Flavobacteriales bacterium]|nr:hypothetical protein [Flavobacteriales bacterium]
MKIFVAKLSQSTTAESLQMLLEQCGEVTSSKVIMDPQTGRSKCYGFVEMSDDEKAAQAIAELEGVEYEGSVITLKEAVPHEEYKKTHPSTPAPMQRPFRPRQNNNRGNNRSERAERPQRPQGNGQYQRPNNGGYRPRQNNNGNYRQQQNNGGYRPRQNNNGGYQQRPYYQRGENMQQRPYRRYDNENTTPSEE